MTIKTSNAQLVQKKRILVEVKDGGLIKLTDKQMNEKNYNFRGPTIINSDTFFKMEGFIGDYAQILCYSPDQSYYKPESKGSQTISRYHSCSILPDDSVITVAEMDPGLEISIYPLSKKIKPKRHFLKQFRFIKFIYPKLIMVKETTELMNYNMSTNKISYLKLNSPIVQFENLIKPSYDYETQVCGLQDIGPHYILSSYETYNDFSLTANQSGVVIPKFKMVDGKKVDIVPKQKLLSYIQKIPYGEEKDNQRVALLQFESLLLAQNQNDPEIFETQYIDTEPN